MFLFLSSVGDHKDDSGLHDADSQSGRLIRISFCSLFLYVCVCRSIEIRKYPETPKVIQKSRVYYNTWFSPTPAGNFCFSVHPQPVGGRCRWMSPIAGTYMQGGQGLGWLGSGRAGFVDLDILIADFN